MAVNVSRTISTNVGTSVYAQAYAQQIVDHFAQALEDNACLVQFPVGLYVEFDNFQNQIQDYINAAIDADPYVTTDDDEVAGLALPRPGHVGGMGPARTLAHR